MREEVEAARQRVSGAAAQLPTLPSTDLLMHAGTALAIAASPDVGDDSKAAFWILAQALLAERSGRTMLRLTRCMTFLTAAAVVVSGIAAWIAWRAVPPCP